jgi:hypothetical protein
MLQKFIQSALILVVLFTTVHSYAQVSQAPDGIQFQALATDANGHPAAGRVIYVKDAIVAKTATGTIVYSETFKVTASSAGIFTIVLGKGTYASGVTSIANIDWANGPFFLNLKIAVEPTVPNAGWNANNEYVDLGTSQFWSVPYALYAGNVKGADGKLNTSDTAAMLKPYFTAINLKANIESPTFTGTVKGITKAMVGLGNVDNTSDIDKPISTATQAALDLKANAADVTTSLALKANAADVTTALALKANAADVTTSLALKANAADVTTALDLKVDKVTGKALSTNDYTSAEKTKLAAITGTNTGDQDLSALAVAADVNAGLALKANTADVNTALALKANTADVNTALALKANTADVTEALNFKANAADMNTALALKANTTDVTTGLATKVDKVTGKELSTNDYTTAEKTKLAAITGTNTGDQDLSALAVAANVNAALALKANTADVNTSLALKASTADVNTSLALKASTADVNTSLALKANTADVNTALALKANTANVTSLLAAKADVVNVNNAIAAINTSLGTKADAVAVNNSIAVINNSLNTKADVVALNNAVATLNGTLATKENTSNKSVNITTDAASDTKYPSVKSVKTYVDAQVAGANIADADANTKGKIQLAGDLAGTAAAPTVPGLVLKEDLTNKSIDVTTDAASDTKYPSVKSVKTYVDAQVAGATIADADANTKGKIQLAGDLGGTAAAPTVPGLTLKAPLASPTFTGTVTTDIINTGALSATSVTAPTYASAPKALSYTGSTINWNPAQGLNAAITLTQNSTLSFTAAPPVGSYGTVVLTQDATGNRTITLPSINGVANKVLGSASTSTVALSTAANAKDILNFYFDGSSCYWNIGQGYGSAATAASTNLATSVSGTLAVANGGTGATTLTGLIKGSGTNALTAAVAGTDYQAPITLTTTGTGAATFSGTTLNIPLVSSTVSAGTISGTVAIANGGTGSTVKNFVDLSSNQTIAGAKAFSSDLNIYGITAGRGNSGVSYNTVFGLAALNVNTTGNYNNAFGSQALAANVDGYFNSAFGQTSLFKNTSGYDNSAYGFNALNGSVSGSNNSALGSNSAVNNSTGSNNTAIGMSALALNTTGSNNTALGYQANVGANNLTNATAIGNGAIVSASNTIQLGNANVTNVNTSGGLTAASITTPIYASTPQALTDGSTVVWNPVLGLNASVTLAGNRNLTFLSTPIAGSYGTLVVTQDGTGNRTLNLPSAANKVLGSSSTTTIALSTAAGAKDIVNFYYDGTNYFWNVGQGYGTASASTATNLATGVTGTLPVSNGGTGATTLTGLVKGSGTSALTAAVAGTDYLAPNGSAANLTNFPTLNQNTTGNAANVTGIVSVANGGTGVTSSTGSGNLVLSVSPAFTGTPTAPTAPANTNTTQLATTAFVTSALSLSGLPSQSGNNGKFLTTNGSSVSWASSAGVPYSGASGAVNLGDYNLTVRGIKIGTSGTDNFALINNMVIGRDALVNTTNGYNNMAIGNTALYTNVGGYNNVGIGNESQYKNLWGWGNVSLGVATINQNETGNFNTAVGHSAGYFLTSSYNTAIGHNALDGQADGGGNTGVGVNAGAVPWNQRTYNSTFLGYNAKAQSGLDNVIVIGYNAYTNEHHTIQLGDNRIVKLKTSGTIWSNGSQLTSDLRLKTNIKPLPNSIDLIMKLNPVSYNKKNSIESKDYNKTENGFIAQELQKVIPYIVKEGADKDKILSVDYNSIIPVLTKGIQEQQLLINAQQKQIDEMKLILQNLLKEKK